MFFKMTETETELDPILCFWTAFNGSPATEKNFWSTQRNALRAGFGCVLDSGRRFWVLRRIGAKKMPNSSDA